MGRIFCSRNKAEHGAELQKFLASESNQKFVATSTTRLGCQPASHGESPQYTITTRASNKPSRRFHNHGEGPYLGPYLGLLLVKSARIRNCENFSDGSFAALLQSNISYFHSAAARHVSFLSFHNAGEVTAATKMIHLPFYVNPILYEWLTFVGFSTRSQLRGNVCK